MNLNWKTANKIDNELKQKFPEINPVVLQLLKNRNIVEQKEIDAFLNPDYSVDQNEPELFKDMNKALERVDKALKNQEKVVIHGDYDADGVCSTCLLKQTLEAVGIKNLSIYIPDRESEGYGLNKNTIKKFIEDKVNLIITVDCGVANKDEVKLAKENGIDTIITDHHAEPLELPVEAVAILDPAIESEPYPFKKLAGVGVAFKLAHALVERYKLGDGFSKWLLDLVAISTVTDCMPLLGENRTLVKYGLIVLSKTRRVGLQELIQTIGNNFTQIDSQIIGFRIGPRLNAAGRMDHANTAYKLLATSSQQEAIDLTKQLNDSNTRRQKITETITKQVKKQIKDQDQDVYFAFSHDWSVGILGLVAGKIADEFSKPTFVITENNGEISGSGRSIESLNLIETIQECEEFLDRYGGHAQACGFTLKKDRSLEDFQNKFRQLAQAKLQGKDLRKTLNIEAELKLTDVNWSLMSELEKFEPFGEGNPKPCFLIENLRVSDWQLVGKNNNHLRLIVEQDKIIQKAIGFGFGKIANKLKRGGLIDLVFELDVNEWNGNRELQLKIVDVKVLSPQPLSASGEGN